MSVARALKNFAVFIQRTRPGWHGQVKRARVGGLVQIGHQAKLRGGSVVFSFRSKQSQHGVAPQIINSKADRTRRSLTVTEMLFTLAKGGFFLFFVFF